MSFEHGSDDHAIRAITDDASFRVIVARTTKTVQGILKAQEAPASVASSLGDLLTATVLFRETMSPGLRVQGILSTQGGGASLVADSAPEGCTRGLIQNRAALASTGPFDTLRMMRTLHNGSINQGTVHIDAGGSTTQAMMAYMQNSEQVDTMLAVGTRITGDSVVAGGYMVQLLPEVGKAPLAVMAERLEDFRTIDHLLTPGFSPEELLNELLYRMPHTRLETTPIAFECWCSESRVLGALATLPREEIQSMIDDGQVLEIGCDYCRKEYRVQPTTLVGLIQQS